MKFKLEPVGEIEVSGIKYVVENEAVFQMKDGKPVMKDGDPVFEKIGETVIWELVVTKKGPRWLKWLWGTLQVMEKVITGKSPVEMKTMIEHAAFRRDIDVWFHGDTCNIRHIKNFYDVYPHNPEVLKRERLMKDLKKEVTDAEGEIRAIQFAIVADRGPKKSRNPPAAPGCRCGMPVADKPIEDPCHGCVTTDCGGCGE
jgi:hypothetical protein